MRVFQLMVIAMAGLSGSGCVTSAATPSARADSSAMPERGDSIDRGNGLVEFAELPSNAFAQGADGNAGAATSTVSAAQLEAAPLSGAGGQVPTSGAATVGGGEKSASTLGTSAVVLGTTAGVNSGGGSGNGKPAYERAPGNGDDIVALRLRKAAESEVNPELRRKLWQEYVNYTKNAQTP